MSDAGLEAIARSPHLTHLHELRVGNNQIGPRGIQALSESDLFTRIKKLDLRNNRFSVNTFTQFTHSPKFKGLEDFRF